MIIIRGLRYQIDNERAKRLLNVCPRYCWVAKGSIAVIGRRKAEDGMKENLKESVAAKESSP